MALTLVATPQTPPPWSILLEIGGAAFPITITRTANGRSTVIRNGNAVIADQVVDYDAPFGVALHYRVLDNTGAVALADTVLDVTSPVISHPGLGFLQVETRLIDDMPTWQGTSRQHDVIGRPDPIFTVNPLQYRAGTLQFALPDLPESDRLIDTMREGWPALLRTPCHDKFRDGWLQPRSLAEEPVGPFGAGWRTLRLDYQTTTAPTETPYTSTSPWTVQSVRDTHATVAEVRDLYANVAFLGIGQQVTP